MCWVVMGVSGCGKSSVGQALATALAIPFVEGDDFHCPTNVAKMSAGVALTDADRSDWLLQLQAQIRACRQANTALVLSCSALKRRYRDLLRAADPALCFVHLHGTRELLGARMQGRAAHFMPLSLLDSQLAELEPLQADEAGLRLDIGAPPAELVAAILARATSGPR